MVAGLLFLLSLRPAYFVGVDFGFWQPLTRPAGVSEHARFISTLKDQEWFDCSVDAMRDVNPCRAWDDKGNLIAFGNYRLEKENRAATAVELKPSVVHRYPGHPDLAWIYLFDEKSGFGKTLVPVNEQGKPLERFEVRMGSE